MIPEKSEREALRMFRAGVDIGEIHRHCWPAGNAAISHAGLRAVLAATVAAEQYEEPTDDLPDDLEEALRDVVEARGLIMAALRGEDGAGGGGNVMLHAALCNSVRSHVLLSRHKLHLQLHRIGLLEYGRGSPRRSMSTRASRS